MCEQASPHAHLDHRCGLPHTPAGCPPRLVCRREEAQVVKWPRADLRDAVLKGRSGPEQGCVWEGILRDRRRVPWETGCNLWAEGADEGQQDCGSVRDLPTSPQTSTLHSPEPQAALTGPQQQCRGPSTGDELSR